MTDKKYDVVVVGGGSGGLVAAAGAAKFGARAALVEKKRLGGDCLWTGCVPSKAILHAAKVSHVIKNAKHVGITSSQKINFSKIIDYVHNVQKTIQPHDSPERFRKMGVDVIFGTPTFVNKHEIKIGKKIIKSKKFIIATGSRPFKLPIPGLEKTGYLTKRQGT